MQMITVPVTTDAGGDFETTLRGHWGAFLQARYIPDATNPLDTGTDVDLVGATTGLVLLDIATLGTSAATFAPRQATHGVDGSASLYAAAGEPVEDYVTVYGEDLTFTIANGGNTLSGTFYLWFDND
jgi:hypothetical protein